MFYFDVIVQMGIRQPAKPNINFESSESDLWSANTDHASGSTEAAGLWKSFALLDEPGYRPNTSPTSERLILPRKKVNWRQIVKRTRSCPKEEIENITT